MNENEIRMKFEKDVLCNHQRSCERYPITVHDDTQHYKNQEYQDLWCGYLMAMNSNYVHQLKKNSVKWNVWNDAQQLVFDSMPEGYTIELQMQKDEISINFYDKEHNYVDIIFDDGVLEYVKSCIEYAEEIDLQEFINYVEKDDV